MTGLEMVDKLSQLFKNDDDQPIKYATKQKEIISCLATKKAKGKKITRMGVITPSQWGKSTAAAIGIIIRAILMPEAWKIIGGTQSKAGIIMGYILKHVFDNDIITSQLDIPGGQIEKLRRERRHDKLTFKRGGSIEMLSAENRNRKRIGEILLGKSGRNVVIDDSALFPDDLYAHVMRMIGGQGDEGFVAEFSNPIRRNHFYTTMHDKTTYKIWIDYLDALKEGRFTREFIESMKKLKFFDVFYECKFPGAGAMDEEGYQLLLSEKEVDDAVGVPKIEKDLKNRVGVDVGRGGNRSVFVLRSKKHADIYFKAQTPNLMSVVGKISEAMKELALRASSFFIDDTGMGGGVTDRLEEQGFYPQAVILGKKADKAEGEKVQYMNVRAQCFWLLREWIKSGGVIPNDEQLVEQLKMIKYRVNSSGVLQIQPKEDMELSTGESPDEADALALTFAEDEIPHVSEADAVIHESESFRDLGITDADMKAFGMKDFE